MSAFSPVATVFRAYGRALVRFAGARLWLAVGLLILVGLFEGSGLLLLVPLLHAVGFGGAATWSGLGGSLAAGLSHHGQALPFVLAALVAVKAGQAGLRVWSETLNLRLELEFVSHLRDRFYRTMIQASWLQLARHRASDLNQALITELPTVGHGTRQLLSLLSVAAVALVQIGVALHLSTRMTAVALGAGLIVAAGLQRLQLHSFAVAKLGYGKRAAMNAAVTEHLAGVKVAKSHGRETQHFHRFQAAMNDIVAHTLRMQRITALKSVWLQLGAVVAIAGFVWVAVAIWHIDSARLLVLVFLFSRLLAHASTLQQQWHQIEQTLPSFDTTEEIRRSLLASAEPPAPVASQRIELRDAIRIEGASFRYARDQPVFALRELDLTLPARQVTAFCGRSGAGKSTLADLLLGLLVPESGHVLVDGQPLAGDCVHHWRSSIGYVPQETFLFHDTVRGNLLWARPEATEAEVRDALRAAAAEDFVDRLPQGLDTLLGDRGVRLSGGERQRIALARALLRRPTLLVLDEATSALDAHNERLVQDAIERLRGTLTIVVIAHRLSTVRFADRIAVLAAGRVVETGSWGELVAREHGAFRELVNASGR